MTAFLKVQARRIVWYFVFTLVALGADTYTVIPNVDYAHYKTGTIQLDAHVPPGNGPFPAIILVHGGGWSGGDKSASFVQPLFPVLDKTGFTWFSINYRLAPQGSYIDQENDVEAAVRFVKRHAKKYKVDPARIALMGESAGGHLVDLVGAKNKVGVAAVVCFYGPIDLVQWSERLEGKPLTPAIQGFFRTQTLDANGRAHIREASPRIYLNSKTPPFLVIHGTKDDAVEYAQAPLTVDLLKKRGIPCDLITIPDGMHGVVNWEKESRFQIYKEPLIAWLQKTLKQ
jgi:alpha-L-fucosidase 2